MSGALIEHQINQFVFGDIERFMSVHEVPKNLSTQNLMPLPYIATVGDVDVGFIALFRATGPGRAVALVIQYSVRIAGEVVVTMIRNSTDPVYGMFHCRKDQAAADFAHMQAAIKAPLDYREMTKAEVDAFAKSPDGLEKKQIRIMVKDSPG
jgi:hypothetical protein